MSTTQDQTDLLNRLQAEVNSVVSAPSQETAGRSQASPINWYNQLVQRTVRDITVSLVLGDWRCTLDSDWTCPGLSQASSWNPR
jgi:hypothetical protein